MSDNDRFNEKSVRTIMEKALQLQQNERKDLPSELTKSDLVAMAGDLGIKEEYLLQAIDESGVTQNGGVARILGNDVRLKRTLSFTRIPTDEQLDELSLAISDSLGSSGRMQVSGKSFSWRLEGLDAYRQGYGTVVTGRVRSDGVYEVEIKEDYTTVAAGIHGGLVGGVGLGTGLGVGLGVGIGALGSALFASIFPPAVLVSSFLLSRAVYRAVITGRKKRLGTLNSSIRKVLGKEGQ